MIVRVFLVSSEELWPLLSLKTRSNLAGVPDASELVALFVIVNEYLQGVISTAY